MATTPSPHHHPSTEEGKERLKEASILLDDEERSDITFIVGNGSFSERMPGHSFVLAATNPVFRAMFHTTWADGCTKIHHIPNDPRGFQILLEWLYRQEPIRFQSLDSALITLHVAIQYLCPELADQCAEYITLHLSVANVLQVMAQVHKYCQVSSSSSDSSTVAPSAPPLEALEGCNIEALSQLDLGVDTEVRDPTSCCSDLFNECLEILDRETSPVLAGEGLEELDYDPLGDILRRESLRPCDGEVEVVEAGVRWSTAQCKRHKLPLTQENRRKMLGDHFYQLRLLLLSPEHLPVAAKLLSKEEYEYIREVVMAGGGKTVLQPPPSIAPYLKHMATSRAPVPSSVSIPSEQPPANGKKKKWNIKKKYTKKEFLLDVVSCLALIFD